MGENEYWKEFMQRRLSRRRLLKGGTIAGAGLLVGSALGCGSGTTTTSTPTAPATSATAGSKGTAAATSPTAASTKPSGSLNVAGNFGAAGQVDPLLGESVSIRGLSNTIIDNLAFLTDDDQLLAGIAEKWEFSSDGKTHTFYIRKGVKFHDGSDLTGADVKFSIERMLKPESATMTSLAQWRALADGVELKDDYTVLLHLKQPRFDPLQGIEVGMGSVVPKKYIEEKGDEYFRKNPIGSGPWKAVKFEVGNRLELQAMESHWRAVPQFKNITITNVKEEATRLAMLKTGELDMAPVNSGMVKGLESAGLRVLRSKPGMGGRYFIWPWYDLANPDSSPVGNVKVRKALQLAINSKELADSLFGGFAGPYALLAMRTTAYFNDPNQIKVDPFDLEGAKKLLAEAGYANGFDLKLWDVGAGTVLSDINQALAGYWRKIGINVQTVPIDWGAMRSKYWPKVLPEVWGSVFCYISYLPRGFDSMPTFFYSPAKGGAAGNSNNPKLDELIGLVPLTNDPALKKQYAVEAAVLAKNAYTSLSVVELDALIGVSSKIGEVKRIESRSEGVEAYVYETMAHGK